MQPYSKNVIIATSGTVKDNAPLPSLRLKHVEDLQEKGVLVTSLNAVQRADFRVRVQYLQKMPRALWNKQLFRSLGDKLYEIKWKSGKVQVRALGYDRSDGFFVVVKICTHKMNVYTPPDCIKTARQVWNEIEAGKRKVLDYVL